MSVPSEVTYLDADGVGSRRWRAIRERSRSRW